MSNFRLNGNVWKFLLPNFSLESSVKAEETIYLYGVVLKSS